MFELTNLLVHNTHKHKRDQQLKHCQNSKMRSPSKLCKTQNCAKLKNECAKTQMQPQHETHTKNNTKKQTHTHTHTLHTTHTHAHEHGIEETHRTQNTERSRMRKDQDGSSRTGKPDEMSLNTYGVHEKNENRHTKLRKHFST